MRLAAIALFVLAACSGHRVEPLSQPVRSVFAVDTIAGTVTLPVHQGWVGKRLVWYIVTESSDAADAARRGVSWAPRLAAARGTPAVQRATDSAGGMRYAAGVDFSPERIVRASPETGFPPTAARPGSVADSGYSPLVELAGGVIVNAPIIADEYHALDRVLALDPQRARVTLRITRGYAEGRHAWYISTDASDAMVAALEGATWAPALASAPRAASTADGSARSTLVAVANGVTDRESPDRQGMQSALKDNLSPLNILEGAPGVPAPATSYSPLWDLHLVMWTPDAVASGARGKLLTLQEVRAAAERGLIVSAMPGVANAAVGGLAAVGVVINCPIMAMRPLDAQ